MLFALLAFAVALGILITFHELGHYWAARLCGVRVLRVFHRLRQGLAAPGRPPWHRVGRVGDSAGRLRQNAGRSAARRHAARRRPPLSIRNRWAKRILIVAAGPVFNLILAVFLYAGPESGRGGRTGRLRCAAGVRHGRGQGRFPGRRPDRVDRRPGREFVERWPLAVDGPHLHRRARADRRKDGAPDGAGARSRPWAKAAWIRRGAIRAARPGIRSRSPPAPIYPPANGPSGTWPSIDNRLAAAALPTPAALKAAGSSTPARFRPARQSYVIRAGRRIALTHRLRRWAVTSTGDVAAQRNRRRSMPWRSRPCRSRQHPHGAAPPNEVAGIRGCPAQGGKVKRSERRTAGATREGGEPAAGERRPAVHWCTSSWFRLLKIGGRMYFRVSTVGGDLRRRRRGGVRGSPCPDDRRRPRRSAVSPAAPVDLASA